jgi:ribosomal protein S12 methylthiotransferase
VSNVIVAESTVIKPNKYKKFQNKSVYFTSLGCSKNLVDSQVMLGYMGLDGFVISTEPQNAEVIIVNTCSFIEASKKESIDTILELADFKDPEFGNCEALVVSGCMAQRYSEQLEAELPEVDLIIGTGEYNKIVKLLKAYDDGKLDAKSFVEIPKFIHTEYDPRLNTSPSYMAWLKISEGCNRNCTFCIIPTLRGKLRSRSVESLVTEGKLLAESGVKELNLISQVSRRYQLAKTILFLPR